MFQDFRKQIFNALNRLLYVSVVKEVLSHHLRKLLTYVQVLMKCGWPLSKEDAGNG